MLLKIDFLFIFLYQYLKHYVFSIDPRLLANSKILAPNLNFQPAFRYYF